MFRLQMNKNHVVVEETEMITSGSVNVYDVEFRFNEDWEGLERIAVFRAGNVMIQTILPPDNRVTMPWEVMVEPSLVLYVGVYGRNCETGDIVLPTVWASIGTIQVGVVTTLGGLYMPCDAIIDIKYRIADLQQKLDEAWKTYLDPADVYKRINEAFSDMDALVRLRISILGYLTEPEARELIRFLLPLEIDVWGMIDAVVGPNLGLTMADVLNEINTKLKPDQRIQDEFYRLGILSRSQANNVIAENLPLEDNVWSMIDAVVGGSLSITEAELAAEIAAKLKPDQRIEEELYRLGYVGSAGMSGFVAENLPTSSDAKTMVEGVVGPDQTMTEEKMNAMISEANTEVTETINNFFESSSYQSSAEVDVLLAETVTSTPATETEISNMISSIIGNT